MIRVTQWKTDWSGEHGSGRVEVAQYNGHTLTVTEWGANYIPHMDGEALPTDQRREGHKLCGTAAEAKDYAQAWADGKVKKPRGILAPEFGFFYYQTRQMVSVSQIVDGRFEVQIEDPFTSRTEGKRKIFRAGQHEAAAAWAAKQVAAHMTRTIAAFHATRRGSGEPEPERYDPWLDDDRAWL